MVERNDVATPFTSMRLHADALSVDTSSCNRGGLLIVPPL